MPLSPSTRLGLIRNDGTDAFKRTDFIANWDKLDNNPGVFPCTAIPNTRPAWGLAQKGQTILETDTNRHLVWTGSTWVPPSNYVSFTNYIGGEPNLTFGTTTTPVPLGTVAVPRASVINIAASIQIGAADNVNNGMAFQIHVDGVNTSLTMPVYFNGRSDGARIVGQVATLYGRASVAAGNRVVTILSDPQAAGGAMTVRRVQALVFLSEA